MRLAYYAGASTAAAAACLLKAFHQRPNFYSATVYLSQSNACLLVLTNLILVMVCSFIYGLQRLLYGRLRPIEIEQLSEKAWYAVLDTLLAMPSFRENVGGWLLAMFTLLLAGKVWGWIGEGRVDVLEQQPPANPRLFHLRLATSLIVSVAFDLWMLDFCVETVLSNPRPGMMVIFTFEFAILSVFSLFTLCRYILNVGGIYVEKKQMEKAIEGRKEEIKAERAAARQNETDDSRPAPAEPPNDEPIEVDENEIDVPGWEEKRRYLFGLELFTDFIKLLIYIVFFTVSITFNGLPMHIMRDVYMTFASFSKRVGDYMAYRRATSDMNTRYPDATTEEIRGDSCIVCRETMVAWEQPAAQHEAQPADQQPGAAPAPSRRRDEGLRAKKLPCGHILHLRCLKAWLERQQVCPTCRRPVVTADAPAPPAQAGAAGANAPAPGQQPQQPARRQHRARIFDLGLVRIGFVNGPGANIPNIVRQMQNPNAAAAPAQNGGQHNQNQNQQGPNHLGLQEPYAPGAQQPALQPSSQAGAAVTGSLTPIQVQLMQMEQRLMQEAHNLNLEQQQYGTLRAMEAELARLRAFHMPAQQLVGTATAAAAQRQFPQPFPQGIAPFPVMGTWMGQAQPMPALRDLLQGSAGQQLGNGHENLPEGMVLPEGWTLTPLQRVLAPGRPGMNVQPTPNHSNPPDAEVHVSSAADAVPGNATAPTNAEAQPSNATQTATVPLNDNGSPLFVPTAAAAPTNDGPAQPAPSQSAQASPWGSEGWSLSSSDPPNGHPVASQQNSTVAHDLSNEHDSQGNGGDGLADSSSREEANREDGKEGSSSVTNDESSKRTTHVEEVPDAGT